MRTESGALRRVRSGWMWATACMLTLGCQQSKDGASSGTQAVDKRTSALSGENLAGANLAGANLAGNNLAGANLAGTNLAGSNLAGSNLAGANLAGNNLAGTNLAGANLAGANSGQNIHALTGTVGGMLYSGEDVWATTQERCVVMGIGSTAFAKLLGQQSVNATMNVALGKLPWGFTATSG